MLPFQQELRAEVPEKAQGFRRDGGKGSKATGPVVVREGGKFEEEQGKRDSGVAGRKVLPSGGGSAFASGSKVRIVNASPLAKILAGRPPAADNPNKSGEAAGEGSGDGSPGVVEQAEDRGSDDDAGRGTRTAASETLARGGLRGAVIAKRGGTGRTAEAGGMEPQGGVSDPNVARSRERGHLGYFRPIRCFECGHEHKGSRSAKSSACPKCGTLVNLADVEVNCRYIDPIRTRGDVTVLRNGRLCGSQTICRDLILHGSLECPAEIDGDLVIRGDAEIHVPVTCGRLIIERAATLKVVVPIRVSSGEIDGEMSGDIISDQSVRIGGRGVVVGDVTACAIKIEPGGALDGRMNIVRAKKPDEAIGAEDPEA